MRKKSFRKLKPSELLWWDAEGFDKKKYKAHYVSFHGYSPGCSNNCCFVIYEINDEFFKNILKVCRKDLRRKRC